MPDESQPIHPRKLEIVDAAVTCFLENGYHQTGVRDIVRQAGISLGNLYNHFKGKEAILEFIAEIEGQELSGFIDRLTTSDDARSTLEWFIQEYAAYVALPENALLGVEILTEALRNPTIADVFGRNRNKLISSLSDCISQGAKSGAFVLQSEPRAVAYLILDALEGQGLRSLSSTAEDTSPGNAISGFILKGLSA